MKIDTSLILTLGILLSGIELILGVGFHREAGEFCYEDPKCDEKSEKWGSTCKTGVHQSPIDLHQPSQLELLLQLQAAQDISVEDTFYYGIPTEVPYRDLNFNNEYRTESFYISNNGHTITVKLKPSASAEMTGFELENAYIFAQAHFHWGSRGSKGSEHTIRGRRFSLELHLVHYSSKYLDMAEAEKANDPKAIAVVAVFLEESRVAACRDGSICFEGHKALRPIIKHLPLKYNPQGIRVDRQLDLTDFLPKSGDAVYRYFGSLTTPNCTEKVIWTVAELPVFISSSDVKAFHQIQDEMEDPLLNNFRSTQKSHHPQIEYFYVN